MSVLLKTGMAAPMTASDRDDYDDAAQKAFYELRTVTGNMMKQMIAEHGNSNADVMFFAIEAALIMTAADLAIFRKDKFDSGVAVNAKTFGEMAALHFKGMLAINKAKGTS